MQYVTHRDSVYLAKLMYLKGVRLRKRYMGNMGRYAKHMTTTRVVQIESKTHPRCSAFSTMRTSICSNWGREGERRNEGREGDGRKGKGRDGEGRGGEGREEGGNVTEREGEEVR